MVLTFVELSDGAVAEESLEALTLARGLADDTQTDLRAVVIGDVPEGVRDELGTFGVASVIRITHDDLHPYVPGGWAAALDEVIIADEPVALVGAGIERTQEVFARLGARRDQQVAANCNEVTPGDAYAVIRQRWGGSLLEEATLEGDPKLLTVTPHEVSARPAGSKVDPEVEEHEVALDDADMRVRIDRVEEADIEGIPLGEARFVVGGGRGVGSSTDFDQLEELADLLRGTVGSSRAAVNEGWRPHDDQIGLTGAKISPELYMPCGISGAVQHWVGCKGSKHILAVNTDPEAAIIQKSDWAVIGDLHELVPAVIEEVKARQ